MDAMRMIQGVSRTEAADVLLEAPDCSWLRRAMADPDVGVVSLGVFWANLGPAERWPVVLWRVTYRERARIVAVYWRGRWQCQTRAGDVVPWDQYAGVPSQRPAWRDGEVGPSNCLPTGEAAAYRGSCTPTRAT
jgi:hypothetical protein